MRMSSAISAAAAFAPTARSAAAWSSGTIVDDPGPVDGVGEADAAEGPPVDVLAAGVGVGVGAVVGALLQAVLEAVVAGVSDRAAPSSANRPQPAAATATADTAATVRAKRYARPRARRAGIRVSMGCPS
ncbi:hypothetical protein LO772_34150 [Yinghuangia sp. ASG 101]|uniref:hypothetical protein n=1 Tax=Yinghuangia sp. ASG 101 TaxID=2896848 RepID=UPI001E4F1C01|nr:hypothetical protein [Yinghuangia sp. ASG 101]UGQ11755.1 hypothetical protein LO772_34150 [Yinghuangia sp. ASG 101]